MTKVACGTFCHWKWLVQLIHHVFGVGILLTWRYNYSYIIIVCRHVCYYVYSSTCVLSRNRGIPRGYPRTPPSAAIHSIVTRLHIPIPWTVYRNIKGYAPMWSPSALLDVVCLSKEESWVSMLLFALNGQQTVHIAIRIFRGLWWANVF